MSPVIFCCKKKDNRETGNCVEAAQTELQHVPMFYLTEPIITVIVEMKAEFSEVY